MKYLLMTCPGKQSFKSLAAALLASSQFLGSMDRQEGLSKFMLFCLSGIQMMAQISHLGLVLKLANDISAGMGLHFWATVLGKL